jgi:hypothetical protein
MSDKPSTLVLFLIAVFAINASHAQSEINDDIVSSVHRFNFNISIKSVVPFHNRFLCLDDNGILFFVSPNSGQIDSSIKKSAASFHFQEIRLINDTIVGGERFQSYFFDGMTKTWKLYKFKRNIYPGDLIFQDEKYFISSTCSGEWGGTIYFTNKKTGRTYESICTCAVNVIKLPKYYNVTASLSHMSGFATIFNVRNPTKLKLHRAPKTAQGSTPKRPMAVGSNESNSWYGVNKLADTVGLTCAGSFKYNNSLLYVVEHESFRERPSIWIDSIQNHKLVKLYDLTHFGILGTDDDCYSYNGVTITAFNNKQFSGFVYIANNKLELYIFDRFKK